MYLPTEFWAGGYLSTLWVGIFDTSRLRRYPLELGCCGCELTVVYSRGETQFRASPRLLATSGGAFPACLHLRTGPDQVHLRSAM